MSDQNRGPRRVLMFCAHFFTYDQMIREELERQGYLVDFYDERPNNGVVCKTSIRYRIALYAPVVRRYYERIIEETKGREYDYVFFIKSEAASPEILRMLRKANPRSTFLLYLWDSVANVPDGERKLGLFDRVQTFDPVDAKKYGLNLRPLFFAPQYDELVHNPDQTFEYDVAFIGTAHSVRPHVVHAIKRQCEALGKRMYVYLFLPHPVVYLYNKVFNRYYRHVRRADIHFQPIPVAEIRRIYDASRCILDVEHVRQKGLTMRTIEMLGMQKKIITTNLLIRDYDFYQPENVLVIDKNDPKLDPAFFTTRYEPLPAAVRQRYTLSEFVREIFEFGESEQ